MCRLQANHCGNFNCSLKYSVRSILDLFQGIGTMFAQSPQIAIARVVLIFLGFLLVYLGVKGTLEPLIHGADGTRYVCGQCGRFAPR